jgi:hypothetical protein
MHLTQQISHLPTNDGINDEKYGCLTKETTDVSVSNRNQQDMIEVDGGEYGLSMSVVMQIVMAVPKTTAKTVGVTIFPPIQRNENRIQQMRTEAPPTAMAPSQWKSCIANTLQLQEPELTILH